MPSTLKYAHQGTWWSYSSLLLFFADVDSQIKINLITPAGLPTDRLQTVATILP